MKRDIKKLIGILTATTLAVSPVIGSKLGLNSYLSQKVKADNYDDIEDDSNSDEDSEDTNDWSDSEENSDSNKTEDIEYAYSDSDNWDIINGNLFGVEHKLRTTDYFTKTSNWYSLSPSEGITNNNSLSISWYKKAHIKNC